MKIKNKELKKRIVEISYHNKLSHLSSCLTSVDIIEEIYRKKKSEEKFVLSNGHAHLAHLVVAEAVRKTWINEDDFYGGAIARNFYQIDAEDLIEKYGIHCDRRAGCDVSTGSLGHGLGISLGMALADRSKNVYCIISDGEVAEGVCWEVFRIQKEQNLDNLRIYCNINGFGAYREINGMQLSNQLEYMSWCTPVFTSLLGFPEWLTTQEGHYEVLDEKRYKELLEVLK